MPVVSTLSCEKCTKNNYVFEALDADSPIGVVYIKKKAFKARPTTIQVSVDTP